MNIYRKYQAQEVAASWTRIDMLLALYDGAIERLEKAESALQSGDNFGAVSLISRVQLIIAELAAGVRVDVEPEMGTNMLRLYEYSSHQLSHPDGCGIGYARQILLTLREGFEMIREEAANMERSGKLLCSDQLRMVSTLA